MATIVYSMSGEGRGHATRVQTVVEMLLPQHRFILLAARDAYHHLYERYEHHPLVSVRRLPGLFFAYRGSRVDYAKSVTCALPYLYRLSSLVRYVRKMLERDKPVLAITDFEPLLPRAAMQLGIPVISLDHQHFLSSSDFRSLPWRFRWKAWFLRLSIPLFYRGHVGEAVSSFHHLAPRPGTEHNARLGVLLRPTIREHESMKEINSHLLVYIRKHAPESLWSALERAGKPSIVYGLGIRPPRIGVEFKSISDREFAKDLATAECLITTAGNQLVGEAFHLGKPVLAIPEDGNFEQELNGWLVKQSGGGWCANFNQVTPHLIQQFRIAVPKLREQLSRISVCGNQQALDFIQSFLPTASRTPEEPFPYRNKWESNVVEL